MRGSFPPSGRATCAPGPERTGRIDGLWALLAVFLLPGAQSAPVPEWIPFQGRVLVAGVPFQGTGQFKFALVNADGSQTYWRNSPDVAPADGVPDEAVSVAVIKGVYSVALGDTNIPNMTQALGPEALSGGDVRLRVWFHDGTHGFEQLIPDPPLGSVPYALVAESVAENPVFHGQVGIGVAEPTATLDVAGRINGTSLSLNGAGALEMPGVANVFVGNAGNGGITGFNSTGVGASALAGVGVGYNNTAVGAYALNQTAGGSLNTGLGVGALFGNTEGTGNTALGHDALHDTTTGNRNIGIGVDGGRNLTTGSDNIAIGNEGVAGESGTIRIGRAGTHHTTHLAGTVKAERFEGDGSGLTGVPGTLQTTSSVVAWGLNLYGETSVPVGLSGVTAIATGEHHTLALKQDGTVVAWGAGSQNSDDPNYGQSVVPAGLSGVIAVAAGWFHSVALKEDGTVVAWGAQGSDWPNFGQSLVPPGLTEVMQIAAGYGHTVALKRDGTLVVWGLETEGGGLNALPAGLNGIIAIAARGDHTVALKEDGTVVEWGWIQSVPGREMPAGLTGVRAIAAGDYHTVALKEDGSVVAWMVRNESDQHRAIVPEGLSGVSAVAAGKYQSLALKADGTVVFWADDLSGAVEPPAGLSGVTSIAAGYHHAVAIRAAHRVVGDLAISGVVSAQAFVATSDREAKQDIAPVDPLAVLTKVAELPLSEWSFRAAPGTRHLGPMAQDFHAAFGLGFDDRHIATIDADGVALAAIQGLYRNDRARVDELSALRLEIEAKNRRVGELMDVVRQLGARLDRLEQREPGDLRTPGASSSAGTSRDGRPN